MMYSYDEKKYVLETESNPVTINYTTGAGRGVITINPARVFPCTVHDIKTIIDILWKSSDAYGTAETIANYLRACVAEIQETRGKYNRPADAKYKTQLSGMIKKYISNLDKIADAFGFESMTDCEVDTMKMSSCEALVMEPESPGSYKKVIKKYNAKQFTKAGITFKVYQTAKKGARYIQVPGFGRYVVSYHGAEKEAPAHITNEIIKLLCNPEKADQMRALHNEFSELCALCGVEPEAMPEAMTAETKAEPEQPAEPATASEPIQETETSEEIKAFLSAYSAKYNEFYEVQPAGALYGALVHFGIKYLSCELNIPGKTMKETRYFIKDILQAYEDYFTSDREIAAFASVINDLYKENTPETCKPSAPADGPQKPAQVWKPCIMSPLRKYGIIYRDIMGATDRQKPASADRVKAVLRLPKMQGYINLGATNKKPVTGEIQAHKGKPAPGGYPPKRNGEKAGNRHEAPQARPTPKVTVRGSPQNQGEKIIENVFF